MKLSNQLINRHGEQLEEKSLTICSGTDYININYQHVICPSPEIAKVRRLPSLLFIYFIATSISVLDGMDRSMKIRVR
jgi:PH domain